MSSEWREDKRWSDRFISEIGLICGKFLITAAPEVEDKHYNTDLMVLSMSDVRIACRIRRHRYAAKYGDEFTIRASRPSGTSTELEKLLDGFGNFFFYGFANKSETTLAAWALCDLSVFRRWHRDRASAGPRDRRFIPNGDGSSLFAAFRFDELPPEFVIARRRFVQITEALPAPWEVAHKT